MNGRVRLPRRAPAAARHVLRTPAADVVIAGTSRVEVRRRGDLRLGARPRPARRGFDAAAVAAPRAPDRPPGGRAPARPARARRHRQHRPRRGAVGAAPGSVRARRRASPTAACSSWRWSPGGCCGPASRPAAACPGACTGETGRPCPRCRADALRHAGREVPRRLYYCPGCQGREAAGGGGRWPSAPAARCSGWRSAMRSARPSSGCIPTRSTPATAGRCATWWPRRCGSAASGPTTPRWRSSWPTSLADQGGYDEDDVFARYAMWARSGPKDIGSTVAAALRRARTAAEARAAAADAPRCERRPQRRQRLAHAHGADRHPLPRRRGRARADLAPRLGPDPPRPARGRRVRVAQPDPGRAAARAGKLPHVDLGRPPALPRRRSPRAAERWPPRPRSRSATC